MLRTLWLRALSSISHHRPARRSTAYGTRTRLCLETLEARDVPSATITTVAGNGLGFFGGDKGKAIKAELDEPSGVAVDAKGNLYIVDDFNERIRKVNTKGGISTIAGNGVVGDDGDGGKATNADFQFGDGGGVAVNAKGDIFIADPDKSRIREIGTNGVIHAFAGSFDNEGFGGDGGPATQAALFAPFAVAVDAKGDVFIADSGNNDVREVTTNGIIKTVAGNGNSGYSGDGHAAINATLNAPSDIAVDPKGNLFILDSGNNVVREVTTNGIIKTIAGTGKAGFSGDGGRATKARLNFAEEGGLTVDAKDNVFIADSGNNRIREVTAAGIIKTIAGNGHAGFKGDGGSPTKAELDNPTGIVIDAHGDLFIADTDNNRVREIAHVEG